MPSAMDKCLLNLRIRISRLFSCQNNKNNVAYLILLFLYTCIVAVIAEDFNHNIGGLKVFCPEPKDEWFNVGLNCFKRTKTQWRLGWENAQQLCRQSENNASKLFELQDWFLHYELAQILRNRKATNFEQAEFWTGWYVQSTAEERLPRNILSVEKSAAKTKASVYNPLWASLEPQLLNVTEGRWCISWNANFQSPTQYGWKIKDCSAKLEVICQTFACFADSDGKPQYRCQDNSGCIPRSSLCDHIQDCADNDDESEENCNGNSKSNVVETKARYGNVYSPGFIVSQGNNFSYSHDARSYEWRITQQPGTRIKLNFMAIDVDPHEDKLLVESMDSGEKFPVAAYKYPTTFLSSGSKIRIKYEPSKKARRKGFHLQYSTEDSSVCVRKFESWNGTFSPPRRIPDTGKYRSATDCVWTIDNFAEETISVRIPYFKLASGDWLAVYDGPIQNETLFANFSSTNQPPSAFLSQATEINFKFWAGPNTPGDEGFQIVFERSCEDQMISSSFGSIESLNFRFKKRKPKKSYSCSWIIDVPCHHTLSNCAFTLFFDYLDLLNVDEINIIEENKEKEVYIRSSVGMPQFVYHSNSSRAVLSIKSMSDTFFSKITFSADCPDPSKVFGAFISTLSARDTFPYRSKVDLTCAGQHRTSSRKSNSAHNQLSTLAHCEASGKWDTTAMLTCKATKSEDICVVPIIENGYPTKLNRDEGELFFECDFGFVNVSLNPTKCINGNWTPEPCCKEIRCPAPLTTLPVPDVMANDILRIYVPAVFSSATLDNGNGSWAYYDCPPGTIPRGKQSFTECLPNGTWSQIEMACLKLGCYAENVDFGHFEDFWTPAEGRPARIKCIEGSKFDNLLPRCIQKNDNSVGWEISNKELKCHFTDMCQERSFCGAHGRCKTLMGNYTCECDHGYRFQANESAGHQCKAINKCAEKLDLCSSAECEPSLASPTDYLCACAENMTEFTKGLNRTLVIPNVEYLHPNRSCIRSRCPIPNLNSSFVIANESMLFLAGSRMKIYCKGRTGVLANVSCLPNGNWDGEIPQYCHKTSCKSISLPNHATFIKHPLTTFAQQPTYYVDDVVSFRCYGQNAPGESNLGYYLMGPESILCLPSGEWSNPPPICVLPQCSAIDDPPPGGANMTRFSPNTPTGEKFAENTTIEFKCEGRNGSVIFVEAIMCIKNRTIDGEFHMTWSVNTFPNCSAYLELNSTRNFRCDMKADGDIRPSKKHFEEGEQANFTCIQPNYELSDPRPLKCTKYNSDFTRDSTRFSRLKRGTEDVSNSQLSPDSTILQDCIVPRHYKSTVFLGASVLLRCQLNSKCQNYQVRWVHQTSGFSLPTSYLHSSHVVSALIESVKISDQGKYVCEVLDQNGNVLDSGAWIVDVLPDRKVRGWTEIISQTRPTTVVAMDSAKRLSGWSASVHWTQERDGSWLYRPNRFSKNHLITPMVEVHTDWLGINVDLADCRDCLVWLSYYSTDSNVDAQKLPLDRFSTLGGATVDPNSHSIQFVLPFSKVWILIAVDSGSASSSFRIKNLRFTVTACAQIQLGLMTFPETTVSPKNKTVSGTCASQHSIMPSISGLKCSPTGVWYIDEENPPICVCESGYVEYLGGCVSRGPLCYSCTNSLQANCTRFANAQYCSEGEVCQSVSRFSANQNAGALGYVEKKCVPEEVCKNSFDASAKQCVSGLEECSYCCSTDYCNWEPSSVTRHMTTTSPSTTTTTTTTTEPSTILSSTIPFRRVNQIFNFSTTPFHIILPQQPLQVGETIPVRFGLSSALPYCIDRQQMRLTCDPIIKVRRLGRFFYEPTRIKWPTVVDNDPTFAISSNLRPELMTIKVPLYPFDGSEKDILWIAVDKHGASATCITKVIFEDVLSPELLCPDLYVDDVYGSTGTDIPIRLPSDLIQFQDDTSQSTKLQITINPPNGSFIEIDKPVMINVTTIDENSNQAQCQFWYQAVVKDCPLWQIDMEEYTCTNRSQLNDQIVACYRKRPCDGDRRQLPENFKALICIPGQDGWRLLQDGVGNHNAFLRQQNPTCLEYMSSTVTLSVGFGVVNSTMDCATEISQVMRHEMDVFLAAECTSVLWNFNVSAISDSSVTLNFTTDHKNTVDVLTCIRRITTATLATRNLPKLPPICQSKVRSHTILYHLLCPQGWGANRNLKCEKCPAGYYVNDESCAVCPRGSYSFAGSDKCTPCPEGSSTISTATISEQNCISFCSPGYFSTSGLAPCHKCPRGSFQSNFGQKSCFQCSFDMTTLYAGAKSAMECSKECEAGHFLFGKKCMPCPRGFFQQNPNEKFCQRCPSGTTTLEEGAKSFLHCAVISRNCIQSRCSEKGLCLPNGICKCQPGFTGFDCSIPIDLCNTAYCLNSGICEFNINGSSCRCPTGYTGARCEVPIVDCELIPMHPFCLSSLHSKLRLKYPSENQTASKNEENVGYYCNAINTTNACPNGQCYQNSTCLCNIGFEMQYFDGNRTACVPKDPCARSPCLNGATCRPLPDESTSAFACDCVPALYTGPFCQYSIRRCSKAKPCENGGICVFENVSKIDYNDPNNSAPIEYYDSSTDSDSSEEDKESRRIYWPVCICPPGFTGLFCESNVSEEQNPCKYGNSLCNHNGECRQYSNSSDFYCECHSGYFGEFCETSLSSCSPEVEGSLQCMNGGTCLSLGPPYNSSTECEICENGLRPNASCSCLFGWTGDRCEIQKNNCLSWECKNGGTCVSLFSSAHCNCAPGFTGEHCETQIEPCKKVPHGDKWVCGEQNINCSANSNAGYNSPYKCYCAPGWNESHACMRSINSCNADDSSANAISATQKPICSGKGTCLPIAGDSQNYFCACNSGRYGSTCEESVNYCVLADVCMNNGICSNVMDENYSVTGYKCDCSSTGHTGLNCEAMEPPEDPCTPNPCQNNGKCTWHRDNNTIECNCTAGYNKADNCTTKSSECDKPNYCNNGTCMTFNDTNYVYCNCPAQQTGVRCEIRKNQNFNLYFTGAPSPVVQKIMSQPFGMQKMVNSGFSLCGWVKYGADSPNSDETQRLKPDTPFMTIMTLGKKMVPIISLSDRHVVFPDVITLNYTLSYRVWHHFCLVFNSSSDESSKIYMEVKFYVDGTIINVFGILPPSNLNETTKAVILLGQSANESNPEPFVGEMSLIQLFNEAVNKESIESMLRDCRLWVRKPEIGVEVGWTDYTIIDMYNAAVMAIYPGVCVTATCRPNRADCSADIDKTPPEVIRCPTDQFIVLNNGSRLVEVYWDGSLENMFRDNSGIITQFVSNFRPGQSFGWGEYRVVYIARDTAGNMATCQFKITVSPQVCSFPIHEPTFTLVSITQLDSPFASQFAVAECHSEDYVFNNPKPPFYTCDVMGRWDRFTSLGTSFNLPSCSPTDHPKQDLQGKVEFNGSCSDASNYGAKVRECLLNASKEFGGFCNTEDCTDQINVDEQCEQLSEKALLEKFFPGNMRPMREAGDGEGQTIISVQYTLIVNNTKNPVETVVREQMTSTFGSSFKGVQSQLSCSDTFPLLHVTNVSRRIEQGGSTVLEAMRTKTWMQTVIQCSACAAGEQWEQTDSENGTCVKCPADTFKTDQGPGPCTPCPSDRITGNVTGCIREIDCYKNCTPGSVYDYTTDLCKPCPKGQFMSYYGHLMCFSCPADHTTESTGSITLEACSVTCGAGEEMLSTEECSKCVQGTYRSMEMSRCVQCDLGFSTVDSGSSSPADCNQIYCPVGFYRNPDILDVRINQNEVSFMQVCIACDLGFYQSQLNSTFCEKCPDWKTTANTGSRSSEECDLYVVGCVPNIPNQCPEGMECAQNPETSGYECKVIFGSPTQTQPNTPFWVLVVTGGSALLFAGGIVFLVVIYRKRWMLLYYRHCPSWLMCFKKMTVNDISGNDYSRDWTNVPMTLDSTEVLSSGDISEPISVRETADFSERSMTCNGSSVADRIDEGKGLTPNADRIILGTNNDNNKNNEGSMRGRSVTNILDGFDKRRQNRGSVRSSGSSVRSKSTPTDSDTASETRSIEDPLKEIRSTLLEFLATDNTQNAPIPAKRAETPPPVPQAHLTVQTSMQRNDKHATSFNARQSGNARRFNMYADSSVSQAHQFHSASTGVGSRAMFTTTGSYAHASNAVGRRILTTTLSGEEEELDPLYRYRRKSDSNNKPMFRQRPPEDNKQQDQQVESAGNRTGPTSPLSLRNFPKDPVVPPSSYASRNASVSPRSRPSHITQAQNTALISPNFGRGDMGHPDGHINEQKGMYPESFTPTRVTPSTIGVRQKHNPVAPPSYDDDDDAFFS